MIEWQPLAASLAAQLLADAAITDDAWRQAFEQTPRHVYVPRFWALDRHNRPARLVDGANPADQNEWLSAVYRDQFLATQWRLDERGWRIITSSSSLPALVARMLGLLDVTSGQRVLEIGTGTGYNTALLCHRLGAASVTSIDIDAEFVRDAGARLAGQGLRPTLLVGDGADGAPLAAPFDRILSTCASHGVPAAWINQLAEGGKIVAPFTFGGALAVLTRTCADETPARVCGQFDGEPAWFMPLRSPGDPVVGSGLFDLPDEIPQAQAHRGSANIDPGAFDDQSFRLWLSLHLPGAHIASTFPDHPDHPGQRTGVIVYTETHRATITFGTAGAPCRVVQDERRLADTVDVAWRTWVRCGRPDRTRVGLTANTAGVQLAWLAPADGSVDGEHVWPLTPAP